MSEKKHTSIYISIPSEDNNYIEQYHVKRCKDDRRNYTKNEIVQDLLRISIDVLNGKYLKLDPEFDKFVAQLQEITIEKDGEVFKYRKSKEQVYMMLIEKGLEHLGDSNDSE